MRFVGRRRGVSPELLKRMEWAETETAGDTRMTLFVAFNYGGRAEILDAAERYTGGGEEEFAQLLYDPEMRDPELVIRTSGEERLSNFLLWQSAYSELFFTETLWPDFDRAVLEEALQEYSSRRRRFGARG
jgi:undecaprenyl diphosphate synthase